MASLGHNELISNEPMILQNKNNYTEVMMGAIASQITSLTIVYSTVYSDTDQRKHEEVYMFHFIKNSHPGLLLKDSKQQDWRLNFLYHPEN